MKEYKIDQFRNVGLVSHGGVGKTSLAEAMLFVAGGSTRLGKVEDGTTHSDYNTDEIERQISISTSMLHFDWKGYKVNVIDMPGYADFIGEVVGGLRVCDCAIVLLDSVSGVEVGTEQVWNYAKKYGIPGIFFINRMDKEHADFEKVLEIAVGAFGNSVVPLQLPIGRGDGFNGIVDLIRMKACVFAKDGTGQFNEGNIPDKLKDEAEEFRGKLVDAVAESNDDLLERYFEKGSLSEDEIKIGLRTGILTGAIHPILCGAARENIGPRHLLDVVVNYLPSPAVFPPAKGVKPDTEQEEIREPRAEAPVSALVFKTISEPHVGELSFFRVYSGMLKSGDELLNATKGSTEKIGQIYAMNGKERREVGTVMVGDMGALVKLKNTHTGDTLCEKRHPILLQSIEFPRPVIRIAVEPKAKGDEEKISSGLSKLHEEDPTFVHEMDTELKQTILSGLGELHLEIVVQRLKRKFGVDVEMVKPKIAYRETIRGKAEVQGKYKRQSGGRGQYGDAWIKIEPQERGAGFEFVDAIVGGVIPNKFIPSVEKGVREAMVEGVLAGYPLVDFKVTLYDGSYHSVDSSDIAFKIAGAMALRKAVSEANPVMLEPIYNVEVIVPEEFTGDVMGDLSSRRGKIMGMNPEGHFQKIKAQIPLAELYKYSTSLRSLTQGRGIHTREFSHYDEVPKEISDKIIAETQSEGSS